MEKEFEFILFDLDGTLIDTGAGIINGVKYSLKKLGYPLNGNEDFDFFVGPPLKETFQSRLGFDEQKASNAVLLFRKYYAEQGKLECSPYCDMIKVLKVLNENGKKIFVATSKPTTFSCDILRKFNMLNQFVEVVGSNLDNTRSKKSEIIEYILDKYQIKDRNKVLFIGDTEFDAKGAQDTGVSFGAVTYGYGFAKGYENNGFVFVEDTPLKILDHIK